MKNKYLLYLGLMGVVTPISILIWIWRVIDVEALTSLVPQPVKLYTFLSLILLSLAFVLATIFFMIKSRTQCVHCGAEMERQLFQAEKLATVGQLAGGVAHEVNTPASIISGRVEAMMLDSTRLNTRDKQDLSVIKGQADRIGQITRDLLLFAKRAPTEKTKVNLNEAVADALSLVSTPLRKANIHVLSEMKDEPITLWAHKNQIVQVILNLLTNAMDAMPGGGNLEINTSLITTGTPRAILQVTDTGTGIRAEDKDKIFDPFFTTKKTGTGLGLSVSYGIVQSHRGSIQVESGPGKGATFKVYLPLYKGTETDIKIADIRVEARTHG